MSWREVRRLLCVRLDSIGDLLMTTPAIRACRETFGCHVTLLTSAAGAATAPFVPEIDEAIAFSAPWMKAAGASRAADGRLVRTLARRRFDAAVIFTVYSQSALPAAYLCYLAGIPLRLAHCRENPYELLTHWVREPEPAEGVRHEVERQLALVGTVGGRTSDTRLSFQAPEAARRRISRMLEAAPGPHVVVHPGASAPSRRYPPEQYAAAVDLVIEESHGTAVFTGDAGEEALVEGIRARMRYPTRSLAGQLGLGELGALIDAADLLICNNTGPAHIAAALGTPVVDLYALTNPQHTPWQVQSRVLFHDVPCRNCYRSVCPAGHHACLRGVAPERVAEAARELLMEKALAA